MAKKGTTRSERSGNLFAQPQDDFFEKSAEEAAEESRQKKVECLGLAFENDDARRVYFLDKLREQLEDPEFRKIRGFPQGSDEDILRLSDPPYYTACPNPFLVEFVRVHGRPHDPNDDYSREPFAVDVSVGKTDSLYKAHSYHTKVPHLAIMPSILHYTQPGDIVLDAFCGSGQTGVAAVMCGTEDKTVRESIEAKADRKIEWGERRCILGDLSPAATFIAHNYNHPPDPTQFAAAFRRELSAIENETRPLYDVEDGDRFNYSIWTDCFNCSQCAAEIEFWDAAVDVASGVVSTAFSCPACNADVTKNGLDRVIDQHFDTSLGELIQRGKYKLSMVNVSTEAQRVLRRPTEKEIELASRCDSEAPTDWYPAVPMMFQDGTWGDMHRAGYHTGITHSHHFFTSRNLQALAVAWRRVERLDARFRSAGRYVFTGTVQIASRMSQFRFDSRNPKNTAGGIMKGVLFVPSMSKEARVSDLLERRFAAIQKQHGAQRKWTGKEYVVVGTSSASGTGLPDNSVDYVFVDPPFGKNIMYSELSFIWEAWLQVFTKNEEEAIMSSFQKKGLSEYQGLMQLAFTELFRVLKPGRWMTIVFSNSLNSVWRSIQEALGVAGFVVADIRTLDKKQRSFKQVISSAVKQDLVISAYKPTEVLADQFVLGTTGVGSVWSFVKEHLGNVPVFVGRSGEADTIAERTRQMLYDRMVAFFVQRHVAVPISGPDFSAGLEERFPKRDGMYFLQGQIPEYDRKRTTVSELRQLDLFVFDEASATQWVRQQLESKPQSFQDLQPQFMQQIQSWAKHEVTVELKEILDLNFFCYDGDEPVPSQIHSYLSTNFKELRNLGKEDARLKSKAEGRWYVPDPKKEGDLETLRLRTLLKEFEEYRASTKRKLKQFRTEAVRAGFKRCYDDHDYQAIVDVAGRIPEQVIQEDEKLLMYYDVAAMRLGGED